MHDDPDKFDLTPDPEENPEGGTEPRNLEEKQVHVVGVFEHSDANSALSNPFVLLRDNDGRCVLIWVGKFEAFAISMAIDGAKADRPLTHDLLKNLAEKLGASIDRIVIDDLWGDTFYAKIWMTSTIWRAFSMKIEMTSAAVTLRLKQVAHLRHVCLALARSSKGLEIQKNHATNKTVQRTFQAIGKDLSGDW